jgi:hypothetical protein
LDWTRRFSPIVNALDLNVSAILDGEIVVVEDNRTNFSLLQADRDAAWRPAAVIPRRHDTHAPTPERRDPDGRAGLLRDQANLDAVCSRTCALTTLRQRCSEN